MKGFVPTPEKLVDLMVEKLFAERSPTPNARVLDPGCGQGAFVDGLIRWFARRRLALPTIVGVDSNPDHAAQLRLRYAEVGRVLVREEDFLLSDLEGFDYVVGNPPYVSITSLSEVERTLYRRGFETATGRFDLYLLFFERALRLLKPNGRLVFVTPEKYLYVQTAAPLRRILRRHGVEELHFLHEETFPGLVTYPLITTVGVGAQPSRPTRVTERSGSIREVHLPEGSASWLPSVRAAPHATGAFSLEDLCIRISCGVATGADAVFLIRNSDLTPGLRAFAHPTVSGREISGKEFPTLARSLLVPYDRQGRLLPESRLGDLLTHISGPDRRKRLLNRTCARMKPWYAFHETPPLRDLLRPKILCKDIGSRPTFVVDREGTVVPRHSVYYIVPAVAGGIDQLTEYLNSDATARWLYDHCQRAANGFIRLQSHVLKRLPIPQSFAFLAKQVGLTPADSGRRSA